MSTKERILEAVRQLPEGISYEQAIERILFLQELELSLAEADRGEVLSVEDLESKMDAWLA